MKGELAPPAATGALPSGATSGATGQAEEADDESATDAETVEALPTANAPSAPSAPSGGDTPKSDDLFSLGSEAGQS
jgi:hypothetical protein